MALLQPMMNSSQHELKSEFRALAIIFISVRGLWLQVKAQTDGL